MKKLYVGNLSYSTTEQTLSSAFEKFGPIVSCVIIKDRFTKESKGFGFVELEQDSMALDAIQELNGKSVDGKELKVNEARPQEDRQGGGGGRSSSGGSGRGYGGGNGGNSRRY